MSLLEAEERMRRDERAELDLRAHVGELESEEAGSAFKAVDDAIQVLQNEKDGLETRLSELASLLDEREPAPPSRRSTEIAEATVAAATASLSPQAQQPRVAPPPPPSNNAGAPAKPQPADASFDELAFLNTVVGGGDASQTLVAQ